MTVKTRFAPSPTGLLHIGNARTALVAWLFARHEGGEFLLRLDDTDAERSSVEMAEAIERDLAWLGMDWDQKAHQSARTADYAAGIEALKAAGRLYPCYETPEELALMRKSLLARSLPPIYDRAALALTEADRRALEAGGRTPHWRFKLDHAPIEWTDLVRGPTHFEGADLADPVVIRADGQPLYHLCSVIDDADLGISHVVRAEDHVANTAAHIQMFQALGAAVPAFAHTPLLAGADGKGLSKRLGSLSLDHLRGEGFEPMAIVSLLARLGTSDPVEPFAEMKPLVDSFGFDRFARATPRFDFEALERLNARLVHQASFEAVQPRLEALGLAEVDAEFWLAVRANLGKADEVAHWWKVTKGPVEPKLLDEEFTANAASLLPPEPWGAETWSQWIADIKAVTGRKGKDLFMPLRTALTGEEHGPELAALLPLIGRSRAQARLQGQSE